MPPPLSLSLHIPPTSILTMAGNYSRQQEEDLDRQLAIYHLKEEREAARKAVKESAEAAASYKNYWVSTLAEVEAVRAIVEAKPAWLGLAQSTTGRRLLLQQYPLNITLTIE